MAYFTTPNMQFIRDRRTVDPQTGCWHWTLKRDREGYGVLAQNPLGERRAHRLSWVVFRGPIPNEMTIDHICFTTDCVNPAHLRVMTLSENAGRQRRTMKAIAS